MRNLRFLKYLLSFFAAASLSVFSLQAQGDATILAPILERWEKLQIAESAKQTRAMIDELNTAITQLETATKAYNTVEKAYKTASVFTNGLDDIYDIYKECEIMYQKSVFTYDFVNKRLTSGKMSLSDASRLMSAIEFFDTYGQKVLKDVNKIILDGDITWEFKLKAIKALLQKLRGASSVLSDAVQDEIDKEEADEELAAIKEFVTSAYGVGSADNNRFSSLALTKAREDIENIQKSLKGNPTIAQNIEGPSTVDEAVVGKTSSGISSLGTGILNYVSLAVFFLFVLMSVPAYIRKTQGHEQSQDAIMKLFRGTLIIILAIQLVGRILFAIN